MESFYQVFGVVAALCAGVMILAVFFTVLSAVKQRVRGFEVLRWKGLIREGRLINVHLSSGKLLTGVRLVGSTSQHTARDGLPYQLANLLVLETASGARVFVRADSVRMMEEIEPA